MFTSTINEVKLLGNVARKPELKEAVNGSHHCRIDIATNQSFVDKNGEIHRKTDWISVRLWRGLALNAYEFLNKGSKVFIEGKLENYTIEKNGQTHYKMEVVASKMILLDKKEKAASVPF